MNRLCGLPLALLSACAGFREPHDFELAHAVAADAAAPRFARTQTCEVRIDSEQLRGTFDGVLASEPAGRTRLQLFPDVGGKILDLFAGSERIVGTIPQAALRYDEPLGARDELPRHVLLFIAITLLERCTPLTADRVLAVRVLRGAILEASLAPRVHGCEVVAEIGAEGTLRARRYRYRHAAWRESLADGAVTVDAPGFRLVARMLEESELSEQERLAAFERLP